MSTTFAMSSTPHSPVNDQNSPGVPGSERPASRYRTDRDISGGTNWTGKVIAAAAVVIVIGIVIAFVRFMNQQESTTVTASMGAFQRIDEHSFQLDVDVTRQDPSEVAYCIVTALNYEHAEVGRREVLVEPSVDSVVRITTLIPTREAAVSGGIYGCSHNIPAHMNL